MACPLPNELVLEIISCLCLKSLIATRGVCQLWRRLLVHADINPPRRDLLDLYLSFVSSPTYESARQWSLQNLYSFDRQAYVDCLLEQHNYLPAHFQLWVLEWPEWAIIGCAWPGLPPVTCNLDGVAIAEEVPESWLGGGCNALGHVPPLIYTIPFELMDDAGEYFDAEYPALLIWVDDHCDTWLFLDGPPDLCGQIFSWEGLFYGEEVTQAVEEGNWLEWQHRRLSQGEALLQSRQLGRYDQQPLSESNLKPVPVRPMERWSEKHATGRTSLSSIPTPSLTANPNHIRSGPIIVDPEKYGTPPDKPVLALVLPRLSLESLIAAEGVCKLWKHLVEEADIEPARHALLQLYKATVRSSSFIASRYRILNDLQPFDRDAFVKSLRAQYNFVPRDFELWILEWPAKAILFWVWPGLRELGGGLETSLVHNSLAHIPPLLETVRLDLSQMDDSAEANDWREPKVSGNYADATEESFDFKTLGDEVVDVPALRLRETEDGRKTWLVLDREASAFDIYDLPGSFYVHGNSAQYPTWIAWQRAQLRKLEANAAVEAGASATVEAGGDVEAAIETA